MLWSYDHTGELKFSPDLNYNSR